MHKHKGPKTKNAFVCAAFELFPLLSEEGLSQVQVNLTEKYEM